MPLWMQFLAIVVGATVVVVPLYIWSDRRAQRRQESWCCPDCGCAFGPKSGRGFWMIKRDPEIAGLPSGGPVLHCASCQRDFQFDYRGRQVDDHREYVKKVA